MQLSQRRRVGRGTGDRSVHPAKASVRMCSPGAAEARAAAPDDLRNSRRVMCSISHLRLIVSHLHERFTGARALRVVSFGAMVRSGRELLRYVRLRSVSDSFT